MNSVEVLIVGAGPTGLVTAIELARRGVSFRIIDIARGASDKSKAVGIQARTLELFDSVGIADEFVARGHKGRAANIYAEGERIVHLSFDELDSPFPYLLFLPQSETERILLAQLERLGVRVERETPLENLTQDDVRVAAILRRADASKEIVVASWIAGCDGAHSTVRQVLNLPFEGETYAEGFLLADVQIDSTLSEDEFYVFTHHGWLFAIFPLGEKRYRLIADRPPEQTPLDHEPTLEECQSLANERVPFELELSDPRWTANYRIHRRMVSRFREGRAFLVGDAAHIHSPAGAQGMNTGIQDAFNLAWKLALVTRGLAPAHLLDSYNEERYPVERAVLRNTDAMLKIASLHYPLAQMARNKLAHLLSGFEVIQQRIRRTIAELDIEYEQSSIVEEHKFGNGIKAGNRAPDATAVKLSDESSVRLYELLRDGKHVLLLFGGTKFSTNEYQSLTKVAEGMLQQYGQIIAPYFIFTKQESLLNVHDKENVLFDTNASFHQKYEANDACLYLIRPDGYIAFRCRGDDSYEKLERYLKRTFKI